MIRNRFIVSSFLHSFVARGRCECVSVALHSELVSIAIAGASTMATDHAARLPGEGDLAFRTCCGVKSAHQRNE